MTKPWRLVVPMMMALGCDVPGEEVGPPPAGEVMTDTVLTMKPDGTLEQSVTVVTPAQRRAELEARRTGPSPGQARPPAPSTAGDIARIPSAQLQLDSKCPSPSLWLYDTGKQNRLCIGSYIGYNMTDSLDLSTVRYGLGCLAIDISGRCTSYPKWNGKVAWVYPGFNSGDISNGTAGTYIFNAWGFPREINPAISRTVRLYGPRL
jgi:hypothetical protein